MRMEKDMDMESFIGVISRFIKESFVKGKFKEKEFLPEGMEGSMKGSGKITKCREVECLVGVMEGCIREDTLMGRKKGMESLLGQVRRCIRGIGRKDSSMELERLLIWREMKMKGSGIMGSV